MLKSQKIKEKKKYYENFERISDIGKKVVIIDKQISENIVKCQNILIHKFKFEKQPSYYEYFDPNETIFLCFISTEGGNI